MAHEWTAPDISSICAEQHGNLSICSPAGLLFLNLITNLFGNSVDNQTDSGNYNPYPNDGFRPPSNLDAYYGQCNDADIGNGCSELENKKDDYDIIVVGAGSAGSVIASRLSEVCDLKVLLLEAGPEEPDITSVPGLGSTTGGTNIDWNYKTQPEEKSCRALKDGTCPITTGRVMGGSSAMNYLTYIRGNKKDFDSWAAAGNTGWTYNEILPYMKKFENNLGIEAANTKYHSICGPLSVERFDYVDYNKVVLEKAFNELGLPTRDFNGESQIGTMITQNYARDQKRMSTNRAYIRPIRNKRPNFTVKPNCQVTKIIIDPTSKVAQGVRYVHNEKYYEAYASKEVIISAGALNSPRLLMLSGIGPKSDLEALNITVLKDAKVGHNYHDHVTTEAFLMSLNATSTRNTGEELIKEVQRYYRTNYRVGPLAQVGPLDIVAFTRTEFAEEEESVPDIQIHFDGHDLKEFYADPTNYLAAFYWPFPYYDSINVQVLLIHPKSRGHLTLNKEDPTFGAPLIYPNFFSVKHDMDTLVAGSKFMLRMENTTAFKRNGIKFVKTPVEACSDYEWGTYDYFACLYMSYTMTIFHPVGTCKMGPNWDKDAVVDPRLRVYGISHLRVVDGSIMPNITHGNTNSPIITIAEKAADMVKQDWGYPTAPLKCKGL